MKNVIVVLSLVLIPLMGFSQTKSIKSFYNKYKRYENATSVKLQGWVIKLVAKYADDEDAKKVLKQISKLRVLTMENGNLVKGHDYKELIKNLKKDDFGELLKVREGNQTIDFYIREEADKITNLLLFVNSADEFVMISLEGNLKFEDLRELTIDANGGDYFEKIPIKKKEDTVPRA